MVARNNRKLPIKKKDAKRMAATPKANISAYGKKSVVKKMNKAHTEKVRRNIEKKKEKAHEDLVKGLKDARKPKKDLE